MEIRSLELESVKSYVHETIAFGPGTNAICGPNGAGKSTILEAIGYALFDVPPCRPIANLVREGEKVGTITVTVAADDEREYQVVRSCGARTLHYVYDPELAGRIAEGNDVLVWLREQFGVEETTDLAALFRDAVGVAQGLLTAAFLQPQAPRKVVFDPLLRVEEYNRAWKVLLDTKRALDDRVHGEEKRIVGFQAQVKDLPVAAEKATRLKEGLATVDAELARLWAELEALAAEKQAMEAARDRLQALVQEAARLDERIAGLQVRTEGARAAVGQAQAAKRTLAETAAGHRAYVEADARRKELEAQEEARHRAQQAAASCRTQQQVLAERVAGLERNLKAAEEAAAEAERLRPAAEEQGRLQKDLVQAQAQAELWREATGRLAQARKRLAQFEERLRRLEASLSARQGLERELAAHQQVLEEVTARLGTVRTEVARHGALLEQLRSQCQALDAVEGAQCPLCEADLSPARRQELLERNGQELARRKALIADLGRQAGELEGQAAEEARALRALQDKLSHLPRPSEREALDGDCREQRAATQAAEQEVARLAGAQTRAEELKARLANLGDLQAAYQKARGAARAAPALEADLAAGRTKLEAQAARLAELERDLETYARLEEEVARVRAELAAGEDAHQTYLLHERQAMELPARRKELQALGAELEEVRDARQALAAELETAQASFRREEYDRVAARYLAASDQRGRLETRAQLERGQLEDAEATIVRLQAVAAELQEAERELGAWQEVERTLEYLRRVLREAGPQVTRALVQLISYQAARLYADIISDQAAHLRWNEDYEVLVELKGYERTFQQLSGGEQMAAALAVRLALLREVSGIDVVFFDEPTSNLDETRRDNLADQILAIRDFSQLFVVSHDDTFERATDHIVRLAKEDGVSRVVA